ncbi:Organ-specific protein P4 [Forsythia ovata]|uniref:Organ-specific protein P4 n=1 Tax=Forsythia ovata TaxID=205694 RepID=A0ABD1VJA8_9LAMI
MKSLFAGVGLFSLILLAKTIYARKDPGEYWHGIMKDQSMPEAIQGILDVSTVKKSNCHTLTEARPKYDLMGKQEKGFAQDFEPIPNIHHDDVKLKEEKSFEKDFEPRPNLSTYNDDIGVKGEKPFAEDFEPRPNLSSYHD